MNLRLADGSEMMALFEHASDVPPYSGLTGDPITGAVVTRTTVAGVPAASAAVRLIAETVGMVPLLIYDGDARDRARDSWQWSLLHDRPNPDQSAFDFWCDAETSIETAGDAFIWKVKVGVEVVALLLIDPTYVTVRRSSGRKLFDVRIPGRPKETVGTDTILHVRGWTLSPGADRGVSPITLHRQALGEAISQREYGARLFNNNATPPFVIEIPDDISQDEGEEIVDYWMKHHAGLENAHKPGILYNGAKASRLGFSPQDAQFLDQRKWTLEDIARIFRITPRMLEASSQAGVTSAPSTNEDFERFLKVDLAPRFRRIEMACKGDEDLFPPGGSLFPEFLADAVLRPDVKTRYEAYRLARQGGWLAPNEIRERENLEPKDNGNEIQETPVGGAPNVAV